MCSFEAKHLSVGGREVHGSFVADETAAERATVAVLPDRLEALQRVGDETILELALAEIVA